METISITAPDARVAREHKNKEDYIFVDAARTGIHFSVSKKKSAARKSSCESIYHKGWVGVYITGYGESFEHNPR